MNKIKLTLANINDVAYGDTIICGDVIYTVEWYSSAAHPKDCLSVGGVTLKMFVEGCHAQHGEDCWLIVS